MVNRVMLVSPVEEFAVAAHRLDALDQQVEVAVVSHEVQPLRIDDQDRSAREMIEKPVVAVCEHGEIFRGDRPLEFYAAPAHALVQRLWLRLEEDNQIGPGRLRLERRKDLLIQMQLVPFERQ